jgi:hypothetical protein
MERRQEKVNDQILEYIHERMFRSVHNPGKVSEMLEDLIRELPAEYKLRNYQMQELAKEILHFNNQRGRFGRFMQESENQRNGFKTGFNHGNFKNMGSYGRNSQS